MYGYRLVWIDAKGVENTKYFHRYDSMMDFTSVQNESGKSPHVHLLHPLIISGG